MRSSILLLSLFLTAGPTLSQNLIPNGSFEDKKSCVSNMELAVTDADPWYVASGTPDAFQYNCNNSLELSEINTPLDGDVMLGFGGGPGRGGGFFAEALGVKLVQPLETGKAYFLNMPIRSFRFNFSEIERLNECVTRPLTHVGIYTSTDSFLVVNVLDEQVILNSYTNANQVLVDSSITVRPPFSLNTPNNYVGEDRPPWEVIQGCFIANGGENHLGVSPTLGQLSIEMPCMLEQIAGTFTGFYHQIDQVSLLKIPDLLEASVTVCEAKGTNVNLMELVPKPIFAEAIFRWEDGKQDSVRRLAEAGVYPIEVILECTVVPLLLDVKTQECEKDIFVPNAFSPNGDGINDEFRIFLSPQVEVVTYELQIFDRWGQRVFYTRDPSVWWNSKVQNKKASAGLYVWKISAELKVNEEPLSFQKSGEVTLLR